MSTIKIGRALTNDIILQDPSVSSEHAQIIKEDSGKIILKDLNSTNGTFVNGRRINEVEISPSDKVSIANVTLDWQAHLKNGNQESAINNVIKVITIGRATTNEMVFSYDDVSSYHAKLLKTSDGKTFIQDTQSTNGVYVNGKKVTQKELLPGDTVLLANKYVVKWTNQQDNKTKISYADESKVPVVKPKKSKVMPLVVGLVSILAIAAVIVFTPLRSYVYKTDVNAKYKNTVVLVYNSYVYVVHDKSKVICEITLNSEGQPVFYNEQNTSPITITGTGFFISNEGEIVTNRHVALPWEYNHETKNYLEQVKNLLRQQLGQTETTYGEIEKNMETINNLTITGRSLALGFILNDSYGEQQTCTLLKESGDYDIDVALMQTTSKTLPAKVKNVVDLTDAIVDEKELKTGLKLNLIGFPAGFDLADTKKGIMANFQNGQLTRESDGVAFMHNIPSTGGASGSPIFDDNGDLVGVLNAGYTKAAGFNYAILSKHVLNLIK